MHIKKSSVNEEQTRNLSGSMTSEDRTESVHIKYVYYSNSIIASDVDNPVSMTCEYHRYLSTYAYKLNIISILMSKLNITDEIDNINRNNFKILEYMEIICKKKTIFEYF